MRRNHQPGTNGHTHERNGHVERNGHASASRLNGVHETVTPLNGQKTVPATPIAPAERTGKGTFAVGNQAARKNPGARKKAAAHAALLRAVSDDDLTALGKRLLERALQGNMAAAKLLLEYALGKPREVADPDRLDLDEFELLTQQPTLAQLLAAQDVINIAEAVQSVHLTQKTIDQKLAEVRQDIEAFEDGEDAGIARRVAEEMEKAREGQKRKRK